METRRCKKSIRTTIASVAWQHCWLRVSHLVVLRFRNVAKSFCCGVHNVEQLNDGGAIVRDGHASLIVNQLVHAYEGGHTKAQRNATQRRPASKRETNATERGNDREGRERGTMGSAGAAQSQSISALLLTLPCLSASSRCLSVPALASLWSPCVASV